MIPPPDEFTARGDVFAAKFIDLDLSAGSREINLGFSVNLGFGLVSSLYVSKNGIVSFGAPLGAASAATFSAAARTATTTPGLADLGVPVIAPYYANLALGKGSGDGSLQAGDVTVQYGMSDPYPDGGAYSRADLRDAVRITWYGLTENGSFARTPGQVYTQLLISADQKGLSSFEFRYGTLSAPGQADYGSTAGFALGNTLVQFDGPYTQGSPTFFEFSDGQYIGTGGTSIVSGVPEPATWLYMILGFGAVGLALRQRRNQTVGATRCLSSS